MSLPSTYTAAAGAISPFFDKIRDGLAPEKFTNTILKDLGFKSNNHNSDIVLDQFFDLPSQNSKPIFRYPYNVIFTFIDNMRQFFILSPVTNIGIAVKTLPPSDGGFLSQTKIGGKNETFYLEII